MKKRGQIILFIFSLIVGMFFCLTSCMKQKEVRIRIRPNDNSSESLKIKEEVKEKTLMLLNNTTNRDIYYLVDYLKTNLKKDFSNINVEYKIKSFPSKALNGKIVPSGDYPTILITIGSGCGDNWWSILYPEYFGLDYESSDEIEYKSYFYELWNN